MGKIWKNALHGDVCGVRRRKAYGNRLRADGKATEPKVKCADGVYIEGWYNSDTFAPATRHDFAAAINSDTTLYPNYVNESIHGHFYVCGGGDDAACGRQL